MSQTVRIGGILAEGRHGVGADERAKPQPLVVDLELEVDARDDDLETTADYRLVTEAVRTLVAEESFHLMETVAERIAAAVVAVPGVRRCRVAVRKPKAAERLKTSDVIVEAERSA